MRLLNPNVRAGRRERRATIVGRGILVEDMRRYTCVLKQVTHKLRVGQIGGDVNTFHKCIIACAIAVCKALFETQAE
jgi:hypothetical protein